MRYTTYVVCLSIIFSGVPASAESQGSGLRTTHVDAGDASSRAQAFPQADGPRIIGSAAFSAETIAEGARRLTQVPSPATAGRAGSRRYSWLPLITAGAGAAVMAVAVSQEEDFSKSGRAMWIGIGAAAGGLVGFLIERARHSAPSPTLRTAASHQLPASSFRLPEARSQKPEARSQKPEV